MPLYPKILFGVNLIKKRGSVFEALLYFHFLKTTIYGSGNPAKPIFATKTQSRLIYYYYYTFSRKVEIDEIIGDVSIQQKLNKRD